MNLFYKSHRSYRSETQRSIYLPGKRCGPRMAVGSGMRNFLLALMAVCAAVSGAPRGIVPEDFFALKSVSDPRLSPDGKHAAYVVTEVNTKHTGRVSEIWLVATDGSSEPRPVTTGGS